MVGVLRGAVGRAAMGAAVVAAFASVSAAGADARGLSVVAQTYSNDAKKVPDGEGRAVIPFDLREANANAVEDVNVRVRVKHPRTRDLIIRIEGPGGSVSLSNRSTKGSDLGTGPCPEDPAPMAPTWTTFDDEAATPIEGGTAPYAGSFNPIGSLTTFDGQAFNARWKIIVKDVKQRARGTIKCASLSFAL